jgi:diadenosine tetraphosphate (Ap4A) HIT family hydrolase
MGRGVLWESDHYRIIADEFPVCAGHVLLLTKAHLPSHMHAPAEWAAEFEAAQDCVRRFLVDTFQKASLFENGNKRQTVFHAHLHGLPFHLPVPQDWVETRKVQPVFAWQDVRHECERADFYFFMEVADRRYLISEWAYDFILDHLRAQLTSQTAAQIDTATGAIKRFGAEVVAQTAELWRQWSTNRGGITGT